VGWAGQALPGFGRVCGFSTTTRHRGADSLQNPLPRLLPDTTRTSGGAIELGVMEQHQHVVRGDVDVYSQL
jgi:hypothetical protein